MKTNYTLMDKAIGWINYTQYAIATGRSIMNLPKENQSNQNKELEDFIEEVHLKRIQRNLDLEREKHSRYYRDDY